MLQMRLNSFLDNIWFKKERKKERTKLENTKVESLINEDFVNKYKKLKTKYY